MPKQAKVTVCTILGLGVLGSICSIVRLAYVDVIGVLLQDLPTSAPNYAIVSIIELGLGTTAACLATLRPLCSFLFDKARTGISSSRSRNIKMTPQALNNSKGVHGSYVTSGRHHDGLELKENGVITVTNELEIFASKAPTSDRTLQPLDLSLRPTQHRSPSCRSRSGSSEESLLEVV